MNGVLVSVDAARGILRRYTTGGGLLLTHEGEVDAPATFDAAQVEQFRRKPPEHLRVHQAPYNPPPPAGGTPAAMAVAA